MGILFFIVPLLLLWLVLFRPQQRRMKEMQLMTQQADFGDEIATAGGLVGTIVEVSDSDNEDNKLNSDEVVVAFADGVEVTVLRRGIAQIRSKWDGEYDDGSIDSDFADNPTPIDSPIEAPESPIDGE